MALSDLSSPLGIMLIILVAGTIIQILSVLAASYHRGIGLHTLRVETHALRLKLKMEQARLQLEEQGVRAANLEKVSADLNHTAGDELADASAVEEDVAEVVEILDAA